MFRVVEVAGFMEAPTNPFACSGCSYLATSLIEQGGVTINCVHKRAFTLLTLNARARYELLLREEPHLLNKFQHYLIASYIGVAPQSLSRLRKEISRP
ncbi:MAG: hypothetical protein ACK5ZY_09630 [Cyclobacteriaceae bacterium]